MGRMSDLAIEREGVLDMMTNLELAEELHKRLNTSFGIIEDFDQGMLIHLLMSELQSYIEKEKRHVAMGKKPVVEKEA